MRGWPPVIISLLFPWVLNGAGCGESEIILTAQPDQGRDQTQVVAGDQGPRDAASRVDAPLPDAAPVVDQPLTAVDRPLTPADSKVVGPDDPQICTACTVPGDCPAVGDRSYTCIHAWYKNSDGVNIDEYYCTLICGAQLCPENFECNPLFDTDGNLVANVCMAQPYGVCALLPQ